MPDGAGIVHLFLDITFGFLVVHTSIIQGSCLSSVSYIINASDLRTISMENELFKYTDDMWFVMPAPKSCFIGSELWSIPNVVCN